MDKETINAGFIERIELIMKYKELNQRSFAKEVGFSYSTLNKYCNRKSNTIDFELVNRILSHFSDINASWLVVGDGNMTLDFEETNQHIERIDRLVDTITMLQGALNDKDARIKQLEIELANLKKK